MSWFGLTQQVVRFPRPFITTGSLPAATVGTPYNFTLLASGGPSPFTWAVRSDTPNTNNWLTISASGIASGTPGTAETETITVQAFDNTGNPTLPVTLSLQVNAGAPTGPNFPLLGAYLIGGSLGGLTAAHIAPLNIVILGAFKGWTNNLGQNASQLAAAAKAINPNLKLFVYTVIESDTNNPPRDTGLAVIAQIPWWLFVSGTSGTIVNNLGGAPFGINIVSPLLSGGQKYTTFRAQYDNSIFLTGFPSVDGIYIDNVFSTPRANGDFNLSGSGQSASDPTVQHNWRLGYVAYCAALRAAAASTQQMITANAADWFSNKFGAANVTDYQGVFQGGVLEGIQAQEAQGSWLNLMADYTTIMKDFASPAMGIFSWDGLATHYAAFRYAFCSCLLDNGYFFSAFGSSGQNYNDYNAFDEFNFNLGAAIAGPNNPSNGTYGSGGLTVWKQGVWRRDFVNGIALVNPRGNGAQTIALDTTYFTLRGTQDPVTNNHSPVTQVTLSDPNVAGTGGSGIVLSRTAT